tara:strand:- start:27818 stop:28738 length:921 start_codon:yes stop_codon:yes gene_type:complete
MSYKHILKRLPEIELPYEYITHKEVSGDLYTAVPYGKKYLAWFTYYNKNNVCFLLEINTRTLGINPNNISTTVCGFNSELAYGTILYGTCVKYQDAKCFTVENILYYKGKNIEQFNFIKKLHLFEKMLNDDFNKQIYVRNQLIITLPLMHTNKVIFNKMMENVCYNVYCIQIRNLYGETVNTNYINNEKKAIFNVKPCIKSDIYELYYNNNDFYDTAYIDSYKTSVFMNNIFRKIKENKRLDYIEESDSEEEFENIDLEKFLIKDKLCKVICKYNNKFRKWIPFKLADDSSVVVSKNDINYIIQSR